MNQSKKDKAIKKCEIAIDKMVDLQQDYNLSIGIMNDIQRILDQLNSLENRLWNIQTK